MWTHFWKATIFSFDVYIDFILQTTENSSSLNNSQVTNNSLAIASKVRAITNISAQISSFVSGGILDYHFGNVSRSILILQKPQALNLWKRGSISIPRNRYALLMKIV